MLKKYAALHFIVLIWGATAILGLLIKLPVLEMVFLRVFISALALWFLLLSLRKSPVISRPNLLRVMGNGCLIGWHWLTFFLSARLANASISLIGISTAAFFVALISPFMIKRKFQTYEAMLGILIIIGIYIIFRFEDSSYQSGLLVGLLSSCIAAVFSVYNARLITRVDSFLITLYEMTGATLMCGLFLCVYTFIFDYSLNFSTDSESWIYILILALVCTVYPFYQLVELLYTFTPFQLNLTINLEPIYGIILAYFILGGEEKLTSNFYLGAGIIFLSVFLQPILKKYYEK